MSDDLKRQAAIAALDEIRDGMIVGLGTGATASHFIQELGLRVRGGRFGRRLLPVVLRRFSRRLLLGPPSLRQDAHTHTANAKASWTRRLASRSIANTSPIAER